MSFMIKNAKVWFGLDTNVTWLGLEKELIKVWKGEL